METAVWTKKELMLLNTLKNVENGVNVDARMIIYCNIEPQLQVLVEGSRMAADMWERLILQFAQAAATNANLLLSEFTNYRYEKGGNSWNLEVRSCS
ncbi:hypothetical protein OUZ56_010344 [Daphnia magna]|uniref:Uncharacterized protein n=1 Tax=Daphnia magna TaxID=35525 RepID=A0ABR0AID8_9CRUS|nr:hypothetical protein OUZ56_010344 [Daphnia magna]